MSRPIARLARLTAAAAVLTFAEEAIAERELIVPFHESGHLVLDQLAGLRLGGSGTGYSGALGMSYRSDKAEALVPGGPASELTTTRLWLAPSADVFVTDHLSVGGLIEVSHAWGSAEAGGRRLELPGTTSLTFLPRVGFFVPIGDRIGIWPRAGFGWASHQTASFDSTGSAPVTETTRSLLLDVDLAVVYRFSETFFMRAGPEVGVGIGGRRTLEQGGTSAGAGAATLQISGAAAFGMNIEL